MLNLSLTLKILANCFPTLVYYFAFSPAMYEIYRCSHLLPLCGLIFKNWSYSCGYRIIHYGFNLHFTDDYFFMCLFAICRCSLAEVSIQIFCLFFLIRLSYYWAILLIANTYCIFLISPLSHTYFTKHCVLPFIFFRVF